MRLPSFVGHPSLPIWNSIVALYVFLLLLSIPIVGFYGLTDNVGDLVFLGVTEVIWLGVSSFFLPIVVGRPLMNGVQAGVYPLWGVTYFRWWLYRKMLAFSPIALLSGSPLLPPYLRLLGARVGRHCHLATSKFSLPMFIEIGEGVSIGYGAQLQPFEVTGGWLHLAPIRGGLWSGRSTKLPRNRRLVTLSPHSGWS